MNGLLRHTSNIHIGMWRGSGKSYIGILWNNVKAGYTFVENGFSTAYTGTVGLIKNIKL